MNLLKPKAATTPIPDRAAFETQIDALNGTKVERVKQPDGTYAVVESTMPLSAEDQALQDYYKQIASDALAAIDKISNSVNLDDVPWAKDLVDSYKANQLEAINRAGVARTTSEEKALARFGQADSTAATQVRSQRGSDLTDQRVQLGRELSSIEQQARDTELARQGSLYNLATGALNGQKQAQSASLSGLVSSGLNQQAGAQSYNNTVAATIGANNQVKAASNQAFMNNLVGIGSIAAAPFTGGASLAVPSLFSAASGGSAGSGLNGSLVAAMNKSNGWQSYGDGTKIKWN